VTNCDKFVAAFCRFLPLGFEPRFFRTISLGDGVSKKLLLRASAFHAIYLSYERIIFAGGSDGAGYRMGLAFIVGLVRSLLVIHA